MSDQLVSMEVMVCVCYLICKMIYYSSPFSKRYWFINLCCNFVIMIMVRNTYFILFCRYLYFSQCSEFWVLTALRWILLRFLIRILIVLFMIALSLGLIVTTFLGACLFNVELRIFVSLEYISSISQELKTSTSKLILASSLLSYVDGSAVCALGKTSTIQTFGLHWPHLYCVSNC